MANTTVITEADILARVVSPEAADLSAEAARFFLALHFDPASKKQIRQLLQKNNRGTISAQERVTLEKFLRVGQFLDLLQAKARPCLRQADSAH